MKKTITSILLTFIASLAISQNSIKYPIVNKDINGIISSINFADYKTTSITSNDVIPTNSEDFFKDFLEINRSDQFIKAPNASINQEERVEHFDQYYNGIKVEGGGYNLHYMNGKIYLAHGHYVKINNLDINPTLAPETAIEKFANFKKIPINQIIDSKSPLIICEISKEKVNGILSTTPVLIYQIRLFTDNSNNDEVGYVDAHTSEIVLTSSIGSNISPVGTFATRYSGMQTANTEIYSLKYHLIDYSRGNGIHVRNLKGSTNPTYDESAEITDNDNNWTAAEYHANEDDMALDIHWTLQKIYDHLYNVYGKNSFDNNGRAINAYIHYGTNNQKDASFWEPFLKVLEFGDGDVNFGPIASVDAVAHEYGHGITDFQIGWALTPTFSKFNEGLSDIWGAILEYRIHPNNTWKIGEQITLNYGCLRNLQSPGDPNALQKIADTYLGPTYNSLTETSQSGIYMRSGVFSHWFYLLVNGGIGINELGNKYTVNGIGMDKAEDLIVKAVYGTYLNNVSFYPDMRTQIVAAARSLCPYNSDLLVNQIENAWYAVGVGTQPAIINLTGSNNVCSTSPTTFTIDNLPTGCTVTWAKSSNLTLSGIPATNQASFIANGTGEGWVMPTITSTCYGPSSTTIILPQKTVWVGTPRISVSSISNLQDMGYSNYYKILPASGNYAYEGTLTVDVPALSDLIDSTWSFYASMPNKKIAYWWASGFIVDAGAKTINAGEVIKFSGRNTCGESYNLFTFFTGDVIPPPPLIITPNPSSTESEVSIDDVAVSENIATTQTANIMTNISYTLTVMNSSGVSVYSVISSDKKIVVPTSTIKNGLYIVRVTNGRTIYQGNLIVNH